MPKSDTQTLAPPSQAALVATVFAHDATETLDREARERALTLLLDCYPDEPVAAFSAMGFFVEMPDSIPLRENPIVEGRSGLDSVSDESERQVMVERWSQMLVRGASSYRLHRPELTDVTCYWLDLRDVHGVVFTLIVGTAPEEREDPDPTARIIATPPARLASLRKDELAEIVTVDETFTEILGWAPEDLKGKRSLELLHPDDHALAVENWMELMAKPGPARRLRQRMQHKDGRWLWFEVVNHNLLADATYACVLCEIVDISEEMAAQEALRAREQLLERLTTALPVGVLQIDADRRVVFANERLAEIVGETSAETLDQHLAAVSPEDRPRLEQAVATVLGEGTDVEVNVDLNPGAGAGVRRCEISFRPLSHDDGRISGAIACVNDVTERARMQDELERRATFDDLTGCHNRSSVMRALEQSIARGRRKADLAVMFLDLDEFKAINDRHGHAAGDQLLRGVAQSIRDSVRDSDIVGRIGGDEFLVVCPDIGGSQPAMALAARIADALRTKGSDSSAKTPRCQVSIGVTWSAGSKLNADALVAGADRAMYESKAAGAGRPTLVAASARDSGADPEAGADDSTDADD